MEKIEIPTAPTPLKQGRLSPRKIREKEPSAENSADRRKWSPALARLVINRLARNPYLIVAANIAGLHRNTILYWRNRSAAGDPKYEITWLGYRAPFHRHFDVAKQTGRAHLMVPLYERARYGYEKILKYKGRVVYKIDDFKWDLGLRGPDAYLKDKNGKPIPETVHKQDEKAIKLVLAWLCPEVYGNECKKREVPQHGSGLLFVSMPEPPKPVGGD
jgi:hypothetical protein